MIEIEKLTNSIEIPNNYSEIIKISSDKLNYHQFFNDFMFKNVPVIIKNLDLLTPVSKDWFTNNKFNIDKFEDDLGDLEVPVYNCSKKYFNSHEKVTIKLRDYVNYWKSERKEDLLYLKDFHLKQEAPKIDFYNVPEYFASDWLNEYLIDNKKDDYRFVYIGVKGTWTPFHADVFNSYSWSENVYGIKHWIMLPPGEENKLRNHPKAQLPFSVDEDLLKSKDVKYFKIIQEANDAIFVPSNWFHQVTNITDVFSINHNWFNSCNVHIIKESLIKRLDDVRAEIEDCRDMDNFEDHCQLMLKSVFGMDFNDFIDILIYIGHKRSKNGGYKLFDKFIIGTNLIQYDIMVVRQILEEVLDANYLNESLKLKIKDYLSDD